MMTWRLVLTPISALSMSLNHAEWCVLVNWKIGDNSSYELYSAGREGEAPASEPLRGSSAPAIWVARNRLAVLEKNNQVSKDVGFTAQQWSS